MRRIPATDIEAIAEAFLLGQVIVFPTETSYAIGCDATNTKAVDRVIAIKQRKPSKGLPVLVGSFAEATKHVYLNERATILAERHWPGALNVIGNVREGSLIVDACHKDGMQAVRYSSSPFVQELLSKLQRPIVATSANISGQESSYSPEEVEEQFRFASPKPDVIVDGGALTRVPASTMIRVIGENVEVVRFGAILL